jgi:hypothetical protein
MRRALTIVLLCAALTGCELPSPFQYKVPDLAAVAPPGDFAADRAKCDQQFPPRVGSYLAHAQCVNTAVEKDAVPFARYLDLVKLQEQLRIKYAALIDQGALSPPEGERKITEADELVDAAIHDRDVGRQAVADRRVDRLQAMLE